MTKDIKSLFRLPLTVLLLCGGTASAQSLPPKWLNSGLSDLTYSYVEVVSADASTVGEAQDKAALDIVQRRNLAAGARVNVHVENGRITTTGDDNIVVSARVLDKYVETLDYGGYRVYLLVQTLKHPQYNYDKVTVTDNYPFSARAFVPGMEQLYKGQKTKGVLFIAGELACVGGIVAAEAMRSNYVNMIPSTHNAQQRAAYTDNANMWQNVRNGCIAAAAAVYVWNVIDALTTKGARRVETMAFAPFATPDGAGLALNINF